MSGAGGVGSIGAISAIGSALSGMDTAERSAGAAAADLAQGVVPTASPDVPGDMVTLSMAKVQMGAAVQVERIANDMQKTLLDLFA